MPNALASAGAPLAVELWMAAEYAGYAEGHGALRVHYAAMFGGAATAWRSVSAYRDQAAGARLAREQAGSAG